ncbi:MAG: Trm112 family protein, partial [Acidobacteriota bacterium]
MPDWLVATCRCPVCHGELEVDAGSLRCRPCDLVFPVDRGVVNFLGEAHPAVESERRAVAALDAGEAVLPVEGGVDAEEAFHRHVARSREELEQVLRTNPLEPGELVVELGADSCWASPLFLDAGCRVLAVDITSH